MQRQRPKRLKGQYLCIPRIRDNAMGIIKSSRLSPATLLERFREAIFRLMMMSALSKASHDGGSPVRRTYYPADPHHSAAVADCIEFIKKTTLTEVNGRNSPTSSCIDSTTELVIPVPTK